MEQLMLIKLPKKNNCRRCGGTGHIPKFVHIQNGICFACKTKPRLPRPMGLGRKKENKS